MDRFILLKTSVGAKYSSANGWKIICLKRKNCIVFNYYRKKTFGI